MVHVPYRGSVGGLTDLLGGRLQAAFDPPAAINRAHQIGAIARSRTDDGDAFARSAKCARDRYCLDKGINAALGDDEIKARLGFRLRMNV